MSTKNYLIFDFGASNGRALIAKYNGKVFNLQTIHRFNNIEVLLTGVRYWDIINLYNEVLKGIKIAAGRYKKINSIGIDAWGADCCFIDQNGKLISNPVSYRDEARYKVTEEVFKIIPKKEIFRLTCGPVSPENDLFNLFSLRSRKAIEILEGKTFLSIADTLNYFLTGNTANEFTRMTMSILFNQKKGLLENYILNKMGFPREWFPTMLQPGDKIGKISKKISNELEEDPIDVIVPATHDTASAIAGIPVKQNDNWGFISTGTWAILGQKTQEPMVSKEILESGFANEGGVEVPNIFMTEMVGLWIIQQCRDKWIRDSGTDMTWDEVVNMAGNSKPFKALIDISDEDFAQFQIDMPEIIVKKCKESGQEAPESMGEISRCVFESLALKFKHNFKLMRDLTGQNNYSLYMIGGAVQNELLSQWTADAIAIPVAAGPVESASIGNLLMQLKGTGEINSLAEGRELSAGSSEIKNYEPINSKIWDDAYVKYLKILSIL